MKTKKNFCSLSFNSSFSCVSSLSSMECFFFLPSSSLLSGCVYFFFTSLVVYVAALQFLHTSFTTHIRAVPCAAEYGAAPRCAVLCTVHMCKFLYDFVFSFVFCSFFFRQFCLREPFRHIHFFVIPTLRLLLKRQRFFRPFSRARFSLRFLVPACCACSVCALCRSQICDEIDREREREQ